MSIQSYDEDANEPKVYVGPNTGWYGIARVVYGWTDARDERIDKAWWKNTMLRSFGMVSPQSEPATTPDTPEHLPCIENGYRPDADDLVAPLQEDQFFSDIPDFAGSSLAPPAIDSATENRVP